jgi:hypothetical protein
MEEEFCTQTDAGYKRTLVIKYLLIAPEIAQERNPTVLFRNLKI